LALASEFALPLLAVSSDCYIVCPQPIHGGRAEAENTKTNLRCWSPETEWHFDYENQTFKPTANGVSNSSTMER
jgi:hypothetical protein